MTSICAASSGAFECAFGITFGIVFGIGAALIVLIFIGGMLGLFDGIGK